MHFNLTSRIVFYFSILAIFSISNFILLVSSEKDINIQYEWVLHTREVIAESERFLSHMQDAETGQRGFLLTLNTSYLEPYNAGVDNAIGHLANLKKLTLDNAQQQIRLSDMAELTDKKILELRQTVSLAEKGMLSEAVAIVNSNVGKITMDNIRKKIDEVISEEERLLKIRDDIYHNEKHILTSIIVFELIVFIIAILVIGFFVHRKIAYPLNTIIRTITNQGNMNEIHKIADKHHDEIGELANAFFLMEQGIEARNKDLLIKIKNNIKLRKHSEEMATKAIKDETFVSSILNAVRDGIVTINSKGLIEVFNPGAENIFGYKKHEVMGKNISMLMPEPHQGAHDGYIEKFLLGQSTRNQKLPLSQDALRKDGQIFPVEVTLNTTHIDDEIKITGVIRDITDRKAWEEKIKEMALTDPLTGLANRNKFEERLNDLLIHAQRFKTLFSLLVIDLDKFKAVNDNFGHPVGDILLQQVTEILVSSCRDVDTVARLGGDEFVIILNGISEPEDAAIVAKKLIDNLAKPFEIDNNKIEIGASVGISCYPNDSVNIDELMTMADKALYISKNEGRNTYRFYNK